MTEQQTTRDHAADVGTMSTALAFIADELHTTLTELDAAAERADQVADCRRIRYAQARLDRLADYVADVRARAGTGLTMTPDLVAGLLDTYERLRSA